MSAPAAEPAVEDDATAPVVTTLEELVTGALRCGDAWLAVIGAEESLGRAEAKVQKMMCTDDPKDQRKKSPPDVAEYQNPLSEAITFEMNCEELCRQAAKNVERASDELVDAKKDHRQQDPAEVKG